MHALTNASFARRRALGAWLGLVLLFACDYRDSGPRARLPDAASEPSTERDAGEPCTTSRECDDEIPCTDDLCEQASCVHRPVPPRCADDVYCNGVELCDLQIGCVPGEPYDCDDGDPCSLDRCDEAGRTCEHNQRDIDEDGEADDHCPGGSDCNDADPLQGSRLNELCADGIDNDCDGELDELGCGRAAHDTCGDALPVTRAGRYSLSLRGAIRDLAGGCGSMAARDVVVELELEAPHDLDLRVTGAGGGASLSFAESCAPLEAPLECANGAEAVLRRRNVAAGKHYLWIAAVDATELTLEVSLSAPSAAPSNETCATAVPIVGTTTGSFVDVSADGELSCGAPTGPDLAYGFSLVETSNVRLRATSPDRAPLALAVVASCGEPPTLLRCAQGATSLSTSAILYSLPPGDYVALVIASAGQEPDFSLELTIEPPGQPPRGELCDDATPLIVDGTTASTFKDAQDDYALCGAQARDVVLAFELAEPRDVLLRADGQGRILTLTPEGCAFSDDRSTCADGIVVRRALRNLAQGTHTLVAESDVASVFSVALASQSPQQPVALSGNDACVNAQQVETTGGVFVGNTAALAPDYEGDQADGSPCGETLARDAGFRFELSKTTHVVATTSGSSFDTLLRLYTLAGDCPAPGAAPLSQRLCVDQSPSGDGAALLEQTLAAGSYLLVVDGATRESTGDYRLDVTFWDP